MSGKLIYRARPVSEHHTCRPWLTYTVTPFPGDPEASAYFNPLTMVYPGSRWQCDECLTIWVAHDVAGWKKETRQEHEAWRQYLLGKRPRPPIATGVSTPSSAASMSTPSSLQPNWKDV